MADPGDDDAPTVQGRGADGVASTGKLRRNHSADALLAQYLLHRNAAVDNRLSHAAIKVLAVIIDHMNRLTGEAFPGHDRMRAITGLHRTSSMRAVADLERFGYVQVVRTPNRANRYIVPSWPTCKDWPTGSTDATGSADATGRKSAHETGKTGRISAHGPVAPMRPEPALKQPALKQPTGHASRDADASHVWRHALSWLTESGIQEAAARSLIGKARKTLTDEQLMNLVREGQQHQVADPKAWLAAGMRRPGRKSAKPITRTTNSESLASADAALAALESAR